MSEETHQNQNYSIIAKLFHWGFVALFVYGVIKQVANLEDLADQALLYFELVFATAFIILLILRFKYMKTQNSALPDSTPKIQSLGAKLVHYGMYISLAAIALSGILIGLLYWVGIHGGFLIDMFIGLHEISIMATYILIAIHVLAAIYHRYLNDGVWGAMVPIFKDKIAKDTKAN